jgi:hypothetical protein
MRVYLKDLPKEVREEIRGTLNGNGLRVRDCILYKDGDRILAELKRTGDVYTIIF